RAGGAEDAVGGGRASHVYSVYITKPIAKIGPTNGASGLPRAAWRMRAAPSRRDNPVDANAQTAKVVRRVARRHAAPVSAKRGSHGRRPPGTPVVSAAAGTTGVSSPIRREAPHVQSPRSFPPDPRPARRRAELQVLAHRGPVPHDPEQPGRGSGGEPGRTRRLRR